jgi:hypothetical protein
MHRRRFVARVYDLDTAVDGGVIQSHHLIAGYRKTPPNSKRDHLAYQYVGASGFVHNSHRLAQVPS